MISNLEFNSLSKKKIEMNELTKNVVVLFNNSVLKNTFREEFAKISQDEIEGELDNDDVNYSTTTDCKAQIKETIAYLPTSIYIVNNEQRFILTAEAPFVLQCTNPYDLWFCDTNSENEVQIWSFVDFIGHKEIWDKGIDEVYRTVINGRYGCYNGYGR